MSPDGIEPDLFLTGLDIFKFSDGQNFNEL
jgi:hypothetical protein